MYPFPAIAIYSVMWIWHRGWMAVMDRIHEGPDSSTANHADHSGEEHSTRAGTAVFLTRNERDTPP
jgi:KUP system potassium uptake protein